MGRRRRPDWEHDLSFLHARWAPNPCGEILLQVLPPQHDSNAPLMMEVYRMLMRIGGHEQTAPPPELMEHQREFFDRVVSDIPEVRNSPPPPPIRWEEFYMEPDDG